MELEKTMEQGGCTDNKEGGVKARWSGQKNGNTFKGKQENILLQRGKPNCVWKASRKASATTGSVGEEKKGTGSKLYQQWGTFKKAPCKGGRPGKCTTHCGVTKNAGENGKF